MKKNKLLRIATMISLSIVLAIQPFSPTKVFGEPDPEKLTEGDCRAKVQELINRGLSAYMPCSICSSDGTENPSGGFENFSPDPQATAYFNEKMKSKIEALAPLYKQAAQAQKLVDWEILPALHNLEFSLERVNPTTNTAYRTPFQLNGDSLSRAGYNIGSPTFQPGHVLTDAEFVEAAGAAIKVFLAPKAKSLGFDVSKPLSFDQFMKVIIGYKSGEASPWLVGGADPKLHAYAWAGFDTTPQHKIPMHYGPTPPSWGPGHGGDEDTTDTIGRPGALTTVGILKQGNIIVGGEAGCGAGPGGPFQPVTGTKEELVRRILNSPNLKLGERGGIKTTQRSDIENGLTMNALIVLVAALEQSGVAIYVNSLIRDHAQPGVPDTGDHPRGRAIDIGYCGMRKPNGDGRCTSIDREPDGEKLYKFLYDNRKALKINQMIWQYPQQGLKCVGDGDPVNCDAYYAGDIDDHYHHIHVGVSG